MNVTLPNGVVLENVPEGTTKEEIKSRAIAAGYSTEADFVEPEAKPTFGERLEELPPYSEQVRQRYEEFAPGEILTEAVPEFQRRAEVIRSGKETELGRE